MGILIPIVIGFVIVLVVIELCFYAYRNARYPDQTNIKKRLRGLSYTKDYEEKTSDILKRHIYSEVPFLNRVLHQITTLDRFERLRVQANASYPLGFFLLLSLVLGLAAFSAGTLLSLGLPIALVMGAIVLFIPYLYLRVKKEKRMGKFMRQFPEGLDLIARALRAGHAFTSGLKIAADEFEDPLGPEFDETLDEINFGVSVHDALKSLSYRVDCPDLKFFVVSVILQRETGGNLAEIIESIARLIRERFKFYGKVRVLSAEGRLSAIILVAIPFFVGIALSIMNPSYLQVLISEPGGRTAMAIAAVMMCIGIIIIRRMIRIRV